MIQGKIEIIEYFLDQFSNLYAVCQQVVENNDDSLQLQYLANII